MSSDYKPANPKQSDLQPEMITVLYDEIREEQKFRADLLKWKIIIVSTLYSIGFGIFNTLNGKSYPLICCIIPFACCYVDILHRHYIIRGKVNGAYLRQYIQFQQVIHNKKVNTNVIGPFSLESIAVFVVSFIVSLSILLMGLLKYPRNITEPYIFKAYILFGSIGMFLAIFVELLYYKVRSNLSDSMDKVFEEVKKA